MRVIFSPLCLFAYYETTPKPLMPLQSETNETGNSACLNPRREIEIEIDE
jgi:hypothetical protein